MPLPKLGPEHENEDDWMADCMADSTMVTEYQDDKQRAAVCHRQWEETKMRADPPKRGMTRRLALDLVAVADPGESKAVEIMLTPWGAVHSKNGDFVVDDESSRLIIEEFVAGKKDLPIDFEHTTLGGNYATPSGAAPAAGWITEIHAKNGVGIFATVKWNTAARAMIHGDEYRYLSPVLSVRRDDRKAVALTSAALTNVPAILDMERVAAKDAGDGDGDETMDLKELRAALLAAGIKLADDADDSAVVAACKMFVETAAKKSAEPPPLSAIAAKLGLGTSATCDVIVAKVAELQTNVPAAEYKVVTARLETLELAAKDRLAQEAVADSIEAAKLNPNDPKQMAWARGYAKADVVGFKAWSDNSPALYSAGRLVKLNAKLDATDDRQTIILAAKAEYADNPKVTSGNRLDSWVDQTLRDKNMTLLSAAEKKAL